MLCTEDGPPMVVVEHVRRERSLQFLAVLVQNWLLLLFLLLRLVVFGVRFSIICRLLGLLVAGIFLLLRLLLAFRERWRCFALC